jgi:UV DNA damage endonuclease
MRLGFAVKVLGNGGMPSHDTRRWQSNPHLRVSLQYLQSILWYLNNNDIRMYRMATALAPYASHPDMPQFRHQVDEASGELAEVGAMARALDVRLSTHPGQYTVLNSEDERVAKAAIEEVEVQAELLDAMELGPESVVVLHIGGGVEDKSAAADRFARGFERLSSAAQNRLAIENDDRTFSLLDVLPLAQRIDCPVVWDILHHHSYDPGHVPDREALELALATWRRGVTPKVHFSSPRLDTAERTSKRGRRILRSVVLPQMRAHADLIDPMCFELFLRHTAAGLHFDVMLEAKAKDLALLRLREQLQARGLSVSG